MLEKIVPLFLRTILGGQTDHPLHLAVRRVERGVEIREVGTPEGT
jgi:hypothetical protein